MKVTVVIDTKGTDKGVETVIKGVSMALQKFTDVNYLLVGDKKCIRELCMAYAVPFSRIDILDAPQEITNYDNPLEAVLQKRDSSMVRALEALSEREDLFGLLSAGNTGALLVSAMRYLRTDAGGRPALAALLPSESGGFVCVVDTGANVDSTPQMLHHFAHLGSAFMKEAYGIEKARIGLLSVGAEKGKGNKLAKETYPLLEGDASLRFVGNVEGTSALSGVCDVLVCDGFAGNQVLKMTEGAAKRVIKDVIRYAKKNQSEEVAALAKHLFSIYDMESLGGANLLGVRKPVIKMHGSANEKTVVNSTEMLIHIAKHKAIFDAEKYKS